MTSLSPSPSHSLPPSLPPVDKLNFIKFFITGEFDDLLDGNGSSLSSQNNSVDDINIIFKSGSSVVSSNGSLTQSDPCLVLEILNLTLITPRSGNVLITDLTLELKDKDHLLVLVSSTTCKSEH